MTGESAGFPHFLSDTLTPPCRCLFFRKVARGRPSASERAAADLADQAFTSVTDRQGYSELELVLDTVRILLLLWY